MKYINNKDRYPNYFVLGSILLSGVSQLPLKAVHSVLSSRLLSGGQGHILLSIGQEQHVIGLYVQIEQQIEPLVTSGLLFFHWGTGDGEMGDVGITGCWQPKIDKKCSTLSLPCSSLSITSLLLCSSIPKTGMMTFQLSRISFHTSHIIFNEGKTIKMFY